jgi:hypothetical protein
MHLKKILSVIFFGFILLFQNQNVFAQQVIITVPSSEVLPVGNLIFKESNRFSPFAPDSFIAITPSLTIGTGHGTELSGGVATSIDGDAIVRGDFAAKKVFFLGNSTRLTAGAKLNPYLTEEAAADTFLYSHLTKRIKKTKTTLTAGVYVASRKDYLPEKTGALLGIEQVIIPNKLRFVVDWMSRNESYSALGAGFKYRPVSTVSVTTAVLVPNGNNGKLSFNVSISKFISFK